MAVNTTKVSESSIMITGFTADDWYLANDLPGWDAGLILESIVYKPSAANDVLIIRNSRVVTTTAAIIVNWKVGGDTEEQVYYHHSNMPIFPYIVFAEGVFGTAGSVYVIFNFK